MAFAESDLNLPQDEIDKLKAGLVNFGQANAFIHAIAEAEAKVRDWSSRFVVPTETLRRLWRPIVIYQVYVLVDDLSKPRTQAYTDAMEELKEIRDGKFPQYPLADPQPTGLASSSGSWGSEERIK